MRGMKPTDAREVARVREARYRERHREELRERYRRWVAEHPERIREIHQKKYAKHRSAILGAAAAWRRANLEKRRNYVVQRRARLASAPGSHTLEEWLAKVAAFGERCAYCGEAKPLSRDHVAPLSRGGSNAIENIVPACGPCNSRKGARAA